MLNYVTLIGRLTGKPELRYTPNGAAVTKFTLAVDRRQVKDREKETDFIDVVAWQKTAEACANNLTKGQKVLVVGRIQTRSYEDNQGIRRKAVEVVANHVIFLEKPSKSANQTNDEYDCGDVPF